SIEPPIIHPTRTPPALRIWTTFDMCVLINTRTKIYIYSYHHTKTMSIQAPASDAQVKKALRRKAKKERQKKNRKKRAQDEQDQKEALRKQLKDKQHKLKLRRTKMPVGLRKTMTDAIQKNPDLINKLSKAMSAEA
ncbi:MAG: hypothetical protein ACPG77_18275, partial [Nannocystaceae bacterium]